MRIAGLLQAALCGWLLWTSPVTAASLDISDSVEYSIAGQRFAAGLGLTVEVNGEVHPTRYPPGLPLVQAAFYFLGATGDGIGILFVWLTALGAILLMQRLGQVIVPGPAGAWTGWVAAGSLMSLYFFANYAHHLMGTAPLMLLTLLVLHLLVKIWQDPRHRWFVLGGLVVALGMSLRLTFAGFALPFAALALREPGLRAVRLTAAGVLPTLMLLALCVHNTRTYGGPLYTGYHYWLSSRDTALSPDHLTANLWAIWDPFFGSSAPPAGSVALGMGVFVLILAGLVLARRHPVPGRCGQPVLLFLLTGALPVTVFHLFYPFASSRFYLMNYAALAVLGAASWVPWLFDAVPARRAVWARAGLVLLTLGLCAHGRWRPVERGESFKVAFAREADQFLPPDGVLVTGLNAIHLNHLLNRSGRRLVLPLDLKTDYVTMRLGRKGERRRGIFPQFPLAVSDSLDDLVALARRRRIFVELLSPHWYGRKDSLDKLATRFRFELVLQVRAVDALAELKVR